MEQNIIPVFFAIDDNYVPFFSVALASAIENSSPGRSYRAIVLHRGLKEENRRILSAMAAPHFAVDFVPMGEGLEAITDSAENRMRCDEFTLTIFFRLFIPQMFPQYDKGIYLDSDIVVNGDLAELYDTELEGNYLGACADLSVSDVPPLAAYMEQAVGVSSERYINSGVLLMNLKELRRARLHSRFLSLLETYHFDSVAPDQDYLNAMCKDNIRYLSAAWDAMPNPKQPRLSDPKLIHYNLFSKPWCYDGIQYEEYFWNYADSSAFAKQLRAYKQNFTEERKAADALCLQRLIRKAEGITASPVTFRKMAENGVKIRL